LAEKKVLDPEEFTRLKTTTLDSVESYIQKLWMRAEAAYPG
jgi:hypothetical protein